MNLTGIIELSEPILLKSNCLNKSFNIKINGFSGEFLTASLPEKFVYNKENYMNPLIQSNKGVMFNNNVDWGQPFSWPNGNSFIRRFKIVLELPKDSMLKVIKNELVSETKNWINRFEKNLFIIGYNTHLPSVKKKNSFPFGIDYYYTSQNEEETNKLQLEKVELIEVHIRNSIDVIDLTYVLNETSQENNLCLEYSFLKDSQIALRIDEYRKSVLDSATAFEIGLTKYLKSNLNIPDVKLFNRILRMNNSISKKRELLRYTNLVLPNYDYQKNLEELRNRAIHNGKNITEMEANLAYKIVKEALEILVSNKLVR